MWNRGDKAPVIAAALGCKVGAVNVARAWFGLTPRRIVSGRPKEPDEPAHKIERVAFTTSRLMEFCTEKELTAQCGHESYEWPRVIIKELVDNAADACEEAEIPPVIKVAIKTGKRGRPTRIVVADNGPGIPPTTIAGIIDYNIRISSREAYMGPTRGRQGNAMKTVLPMSFLLGGKSKGETWIEARGRKHCIQFSVNRIKQEPIVRNIRSRSRVTTGTRVTMFWPDHYEAKVDADEIRELLNQFIWVNPHLSLRFVVDGKTVIRCDASNPTWSKYRACDATSSHWYSLEQFERYAGALIARDQEQRRPTRRKYTTRQFIAQFRGASATDKQKQICTNSARRTCRCISFLVPRPRSIIGAWKNCCACCKSTLVLCGLNCSASSAMTICAGSASASAANRKVSNISAVPVMTTVESRMSSRSPLAPTKSGWPPRTTRQGECC